MMTIDVYEKDASLGVFIDGAEEVAAFKELIRRGSDGVQDAPASMKILAALVLHGKTMTAAEKQELKPSLSRN